MLTVLLLLLQVLSADPGVKDPLRWWHDGQREPKFRIWINMKIAINLTAAMLEVVAEPDLTKCQEVGKPAPVACSRYTTIGEGSPTYPVGEHQVQVSAYNTGQDGSVQEVKSPAITIKVGWAPPALPLGVTPLRVTVK